jgi:hypothetical protein
MVKFIQSILLTLTVSALAMPIYCAQVAAAPISPIVISSFIGGLKEQNIRDCEKKMQHACKNISVFKTKECFTPLMTKEKTCQQNLAFLNEEAGFFKTIKNYGPAQVVHAQVIAADHSENYFIVTHSGELIVPLRMGAEIKLSSNKNYHQILKKYPQAKELFGEILGFPKSIKLTQHRTRLIFKQYLLNGCWACEKAGIAEVGYDIDAKGKFLGMRLIHLTSMP